MVSAPAGARQGAAGAGARLKEQGALPIQSDESHARSAGNDLRGAQGPGQVMSKPTRETSARPRIGRFELTRKVGRGGQGTVYSAEDPHLERRVAIKIIHSHSVHGNATSGALPDEARIAARLQHPNIVSIHDVGRYHGRPYLVFEYVEGRTFRQILETDGAVPARRALALMRPVLEGMAHAHERDVLHLDLSPGNILLSDRDVPRIMDFGLARLVNTVRDTTAVPVGTLLYMAPEQLEEKPLGAYTDVRSLGLILFEILAGRSAITGRTLTLAARQIVEEDIDLSPVDTGPDMAPVAQFLAGALARDPAARYANATAMLNAFDSALEARARLAAATAAEPARGTVEFLLRRMQRREDFPVLSRSLVEVNRMTSRESTATASQLAKVVLRDYALTNKLLKLANSAFYGVFAGEVKSVSHAISLLGFEQLRVTANSLTLFSHLKDRTRSAVLKELLIRSFMAGLLARHLAQREGMRNAEEAFICGMFQTLGETLTMFYFPEEHADIESLAARDHTGIDLAAREVLGIDYATLGAAVAREWRFPEDIVTAIAGLPEDGEVPPPAGDGERLRDVAVLVDRVCRILGRGPGGGPEFEALLVRFRNSVALDADALPALVAAALTRLDQHSGILGVDTRRSTWCGAARECIAKLMPEPVDEAGGAQAAVSPEVAAGAGH